MGNDDVHPTSTRTGKARMEDRLWDTGRLRNPHHQVDKALRVRRMFDQIAPTYELINRLASLGRDAAWRRRVVELAATSPGDRVLDIACGTGDLARAFAKRAGWVVGADFSETMLNRAAARDGQRISWCLADALCLPFPDGTFNMTTCAFGVRNFQDIRSGLREMYRTLQPGGRAIVLEFGMPENRAARWLYGLYLRHLLPRFATLVSRDRTNAYRYLERSVTCFISPRELVDRLKTVGFGDVTVVPMTLGVVVAYRAEKGA